MGRYFEAPFGLIGIETFYSNNEPLAQELRFSVPFAEWSEFENSQLYQLLIEYTDNLQTRYRTAPHRGDEYVSGSEPTPRYSTQEAYPEPFWVRVRRVFHKGSKTRRL